jgi:hypothetical protein
MEDDAVRTASPKRAGIPRHCLAVTRWEMAICEGAELSFSAADRDRKGRKRGKGEVGVRGIEMGGGITTQSKRAGWVWNREVDGGDEKR